MKMVAEEGAAAQAPDPEPLQGGERGVTVAATVAAIASDPETGGIATARRDAVVMTPTMTTGVVVTVVIAIGEGGMMGKKGVTVIAVMTTMKNAAEKMIRTTRTMMRIDAVMISFENASLSIF
mmetsp:Transcript_13843/g.19210  ORF Transcript_13843/g.19210 Transcript_13843/m.19210 type:complete len:123 (-) Transcript_13843:193-561(-)